MSVAQPLTKALGKAERTLQKLLETQLEKEGLRFGEWTILAFLSGTGRLTRSELLAALSSGKVATGAEAMELLASVEGKGLIEMNDRDVYMTKAGKTLFAPLRANVQNITTNLVADIPVADLEATNRTLMLVTKRAEGLLSTETVLQGTSGKG